VAPVSIDPDGVAPITHQNTKMSDKEKNMINLFHSRIGRALTSRLDWLNGLVLIVGAMASATKLQTARADELAVGLRGEYFDNEDFTNLKLTRTDATVDFNWGFGSPDPLINSERFSIRWTGQVTAPASGSYIFVTRSDDGVRLWLNNQLVIDNYNSHPETEDRSAAINLIGGQSNNLRIEYFELTANAIIKLLWIRPGQTNPEIIPSAQLSTPVSPNPPPTLASINPTVLPLSSPAFMMTITGANFLPGVTAQWNNSPRPTTLVSATQLIVSIPAVDLTFPGLFNVTAVNPLPGGGTSNSIVFTVSGGFEADVSPRPSGSNNGTVTIADWTQLGRFSSNLDVVNIGGEYQRADCAPKSSAGDGRISLTDWVQAGRYATGLDPVIIAGGPSVPTSIPIIIQGPPDSLQSNDDPPTSTFDFSISKTIRLDRIRSPQVSSAMHQIFTVAGPGDSIEVICLGRGDENAIGFSLRFDQREWQFINAKNSDEIHPATLLINSTRSQEGLIGVALALEPGRTFRAGAQRVVVLTFRPLIPAHGRSAPPVVTFVDQPIARELVDAKARLLQASYQRQDFAALN
jgi:hypothetical protein